MIEIIGVTRVYKIRIRPDEIGTMWASAYVLDCDFSVKIAYSSATDGFILSGTASDFDDMLDTLQEVSKATDRSRFATFALAVTEGMIAFDIERAEAAPWN
jgi:hypothetical protein